MNELQLPAKWIDEIRAKAGPELDYHSVTVTLADGRAFDATVDGDRITRVKNTSGVPFLAEDIVSIRTPYERMLRLTGRWARQIVALPETGMGYTVATVTLRDGRQFEQAVIGSGFITQIRGHDSIPFREDEIASIEPTHAKWDWSRE